jgi:hypothetical protein
VNFKDALNKTGTSKKCAGFLMHQPFQRTYVREVKTRMGRVYVIHNGNKNNACKENLKEEDHLND